MTWQVQACCVWARHMRSEPKHDQREHDKTYVVLSNSTLKGFWTTLFLERTAGGHRDGQRTDITVHRSQKKQRPNQSSQKQTSTQEPKSAQGTPSQGPQRDRHAAIHVGGNRALASRVRSSMRRLRTATATAKHSHHIWRSCMTAWTELPAALAAARAR